MARIFGWLPKIINYKMPGMGMEMILNAGIIKM